MGNRVKSAQERLAQQYRNAGRLAMEWALSQPRYFRDGRLRRGQGRHNFPYDVPKGVSPSILRVHADGARNKYPKTGPEFTPCELHPTYVGKGAPRSKAKACTCRSIYEAVRA